MNEPFGTIIEIGDVLISEDVVCEYFACDCGACGGACCIEGDAGAPLEESELEGLEEGYPSYSPLMSQAGRDRVDEVGFFEVDRDGELVTPCVPGSSECAFCKLSAAGASGPAGKIFGERPAGPELRRTVSALCAIELAGFRKPISCALYPIRITKMPGGGCALNLHRWKICAPAYEKGRGEGVRAYEFLRGPLIRRFGPEFYDALSAAARHVNGE